MTMEEVEYRTPNGLHDAYLKGFSVDYEAATLSLEIEWFVEVLKEGRAEQESIWKPGTLVIEGLEYFVIEPPRNGLKDLSDFAPDQMHGYATTDKEVTSKGLPIVSNNAFRHSLYLGYWESFIYFAGTSAEVSSADLLVREMSAE